LDDRNAYLSGVEHYCDETETVSYGTPLEEWLDVRPPSLGA